MNDLAQHFIQTGISTESSYVNYQNIMGTKASLSKIANFLEPARKFLNCHFTDYYLKTYWNTLLPERLREDLESKSLEQVKKCMTDLTTGAWKGYPEALEKKEDVNFNSALTLEELIVAVGRLKLSELNICTSYKNIEHNRSVVKDKVTDLLVNLEFDTFMSSKKMHEVLKFSEFIACISSGVNLSLTCAEDAQLISNKKITRIIDVGSGKGYLSSFLALYYDLKVLAIDASASNTEGCDKRTAKLDKRWPQLVRRARERSQNGVCTNFGKNWRKKLAKMGISEEEYFGKKGKQFSPGENNLKSVTELITTSTNLQHLVDSNLDDGNIEETKYGIVGLHTCGNLGANVLKLFLHNENAQFICVVPCCFNLVQEDEHLYPENVFYGSKFLSNTGAPAKSAPWPDGSIGFPLSSVLKSRDDGKAFVVGRNARMLSAYSLPRMINSETGLEMPPALNYRTMFQVLLKEHGMLSSSEDNSAIRVGRMTKKCSSFKDYVSFAAQKIAISRELLDDQKVEEIRLKYESPELLTKFHKYYLLRAMYSAVVEDLILLDRIVYLLEQECIGTANLVQLFDPALSPRSHAIVASKKSAKV